MLTTTFFLFFFLTLLNLYNTISTAFGIYSFWFIQIVIAFSITVYIYDFLIAVWILSRDVQDICNFCWFQ